MRELLVVSAKKQVKFPERNNKEVIWSNKSINLEPRESKILGLIASLSTICFRHLKEVTAEWDQAYRHQAKLNSTSTSEQAQRAP